MSEQPIIAGIDEAGRGPLAGPVVAAACVITQPLRKRRPFGWSPLKEQFIIGDSKQLSEQGREEAYAWITANCHFGIGMASAEEIDAHGILIATEKAMHVALGDLKTHIKPTSLLVDGKDAFWFDEPHSSVIRGDSLEPSIAAASIIAKVTRDRWMLERHAELPHYNFAKHKGYGTPEHLAAIEQHGPCNLHRRLFLQKFFERQAQFTIASSIRPRTTARRQPKVMAR